MICQELVELVTEYLEGTLDAPTRRRFEAHLSRCDGCTAYVEQLRTTVRMTGRLRTEQLEPAVRERLLEAFRGWRGR